MNWHDDSPPAGMVRLEPGDITLIGGEPYMAVTVNDCRAWLEPLTKRHVERTTRFGQHVEFDAAGKGVGTSTTREPGDILERRGRKAAEDFLAARARRRKGNIDGLAATTNERTDEMANKLRALKGEKKTRKPRGGLAADMAAEGASSPAEAKPKRGRKAKADGDTSTKGKWTGSAKFGRSLLELGLRGEEFITKLREKYPGFSTSGANKLQESFLKK
jgi:hypothetical protein